MAGRPLDHVGFYTFSFGFCAKNVGLNPETFYTDPEKSLAAQLWTHQMYDSDDLPRFGPPIGVLEFGGEMKLPTNESQQSPITTRYSVESEEDVEKLRLPDVKTSGFMAKRLEFGQLQEKAGVLCTLRIGTPFTIASYICEIQQLLRWMHKKSELAHQILRLATDFGIQLAQHWVDRFGAENVNLREAAPAESNQLISPKNFQDFALPYIEELHEKVFAMGVKYIEAHLCGDQNLNLPYWREVLFGDPGFVSFGHEVDIATAIDYLGDRSVLMGNLNTSLIQSGTPQQVYELSKQCIEKGKYAPRGFILAPGCELPPLAPPGNVWAMKKAINDFGGYESESSGSRTNLSQ